MRNISFNLTTPQFKARTKTVTRRLGWKKIKSGDVLMACEKCQGIPKGEKFKKLGPIRVVSVSRELLCEITQQDVVREGFPSYDRIDFIEMFCRHMSCNFETTVTRIEFEYL